jgi:hypothetical protein
MGFTMASNVNALAMMLSGSHNNPKDHHDEEAGKRGPSNFN